MAIYGIELSVFWLSLRTQNESLHIYFRVSVEVKRLGGAYGGKTTRNNVFAAACGLAAYVTNR